MAVGTGEGGEGGGGGAIHVILLYLISDLVFTLVLDTENIYGNYYLFMCFGKYCPIEKSNTPHTSNSMTIAVT